MRVRTNWNAEGSGQTEVRYLDYSVVVEEQVLRLQVAMNYTAGVAENNPIENLVEVTL